MLLAPDLRDWVSDNQMVHFVMDAIKVLKLDDAKLNVRSTGSAPYPPSMILGLLIYFYATGPSPVARLSSSAMAGLRCAIYAPSLTLITTASASSAATTASYWRSVFIRSSNMPCALSSSRSATFANI